MLCMCLLIEHTYKQTNKTCRYIDFQGERRQLTNIDLRMSSRLRNRVLQTPQFYCICMQKPCGPWLKFSMSLFNVLSRHLNNIYIALVRLYLTSSVMPMCCSFLLYVITFINNKYIWREYLHTEEKYIRLKYIWPNWWLRPINLKIILVKGL